MIAAVSEMAAANGLQAGVGQRPRAGGGWRSLAASAASSGPTRLPGSRPSSAVSRGDGSGAPSNGSGRASRSRVHKEMR